MTREALREGKVRNRLDVVRDGEEALDLRPPANCYITKPVDLDHFLPVFRATDAFWLTLVRLP